MLTYTILIVSTVVLFLVALLLLMLLLSQAEVIKTQRALIIQLKLDKRALKMEVVSDRLEVALLREAARTSPSAEAFDAETGRILELVKDD